MNHTRLVGIAHLTMLDVSPPDWVTLAHTAGFDAVGVRVAAAGPGEQPWPMSIGSPMLAETRARLDDTGIRVLDVEVVRLTPETAPAQHEPLLEAGAHLGAAFVNVIADDPDLARVADNFASLVDQARAYGLRPLIEPIPYTSVKNLDAALDVAKQSGGGVIIDPLHLHRFGGTPEQLHSVDTGLLPFFQLCDAPQAAPRALPRPHRLPRGQSVDVGDLQLESRAARLLPGDGELALEEVIAAMPPDVPVSVEAPNLALRDRLGPLQFARRARQAVRDLLARPESAPAREVRR